MESLTTTGCMPFGMPSRTVVVVLVNQLCELVVSMVIYLSELKLIPDSLASKSNLKRFELYKVLPSWIILLLEGA